MADLTEQQKKFVQNYLATGEIKKSALAAGYAETSASVSGSKLMKNPAVIAEIQKARAVVIDNNVHTLEKALQEADEAYEVAKEKNNPAGMVAASTLKAKLSGLLIERTEVHQTGFQIHIKGFDDDK